MQCPIVMVLLFMLGIALVLVPEQNFTVQGSVSFEQGTSDDPVIVYLEALGSRPVEQIYADASGMFRFLNVPAGTYYVRVRHEGFQEFAQRIEIPVYDRDLSIFLQRRPKVKPPEDETVLGGKFQVDVRQLSIPKEAVREYQKALDENKTGKTSNAIERLRRVLNVAPNFIEAAFQLGSSLYKIGNFEDAEKILQQTLAIAPKEPQLRLMLANVFVKEGKYQQALAEIETYLQENPNGPERSSAETTHSQLLQSIRKHDTP